MKGFWTPAFILYREISKKKWYSRGKIWHTKWYSDTRHTQHSCYSEGWTDRDSSGGTFSSRRAWSTAYKNKLFVVQSAMRGWIGCHATFSPFLEKFGAGGPAGGGGDAGGTTSLPFLCACCALCCVVRCVVLCEFVSNATTQTRLCYNVQSDVVDFYIFCKGKPKKVSSRLLFLLGKRRRGVYLNGFRAINRKNRKSIIVWTRHNKSVHIDTYFVILFPFQSQS